MGLLRNTIKESCEDQFLEVIEPEGMTEGVAFVRGTAVRRSRFGKPRVAAVDRIPNGSVIHVYPNQFMLLVDGGKVVDYTAEEGYFTVDQSSSPSLFNGDLDAAIAASYDRFRFGGGTPMSQKAYYINLQELTNLKFGTHTPLNYYDSYYDAELFLRTHGTYSIRITDPLLFYREVIAKSAESMRIEQFGEQYLAEFMEALQTAIVQLAADGERISFLMTKSRLLSERVKAALEDTWKKTRGIEVQSVGIMSISYDEASAALIEMRNRETMKRSAKKKPGQIRCDKCGFEPSPDGPTPKFCPQCGDPIDARDRR